MAVASVDDNIAGAIAVINDCLINGTGVIMERIEYAPHGAITPRERMPGFSNVLHDTPYLFVGQFGVQTDGTGLLYMRVRHCNSLLMKAINVGLVRMLWALRMMATGMSV